MALNALEERISKIRQQNEEIRRRHEEVEQDKKNAAKLNALVQMVPSTDWPERKEPPEYSNPPKTTYKQKSGGKEQSEHQSNDKKKGEGPPPDPKYNFLADSERDEGNTQSAKDNSGNRGHNKPSRGNFKRKGMGRGETTQKGKVYHSQHKEEYRPDYEAWRKERNRIDEDRISRQKTAEGNWRREWDNDKAYMVNEVSREGRVTMGDYVKSNDKRYSDGNGYASHNRGNHYRSYRGSSRNYHGSHDYHHANSYEQHAHETLTIDERTVVATDKSIKVTVNQSNMTKGPVMSVKVNSPSIAGTGRVGPRQRTRLTYSSHSDVETNPYEGGSFLRQKSFEDRPKGTYFNNAQKNSNLRRTQSQRKPTKENPTKSPFMQRKEFKKDGGNMGTKHHENGPHQNYSRKDYKDTQKQHYPSKSPRASHKIVKASKNDSTNKPNEPTQETEETNIADNVPQTNVTLSESQEESNSSTAIKNEETSAVVKEELEDNNAENNEGNTKNADGSSDNSEKVDQEIKTIDSDRNTEVVDQNTEIVKDESIENQEAVMNICTLELHEKNGEGKDANEEDKNEANETDNNLSDNNNTNESDTKVQEEQEQTELNENNESTMSNPEFVEEIAKTKDESNDNCCEMKSEIDVTKDIVENGDAAICNNSSAKENVGSVTDIISEKKSDDKNSSTISNDKSQEQSSICDETQFNQESSVGTAELQSSKSSDLVFEKKSNEDNATPDDSKN